MSEKPVTVSEFRAQFWEWCDYFFRPGKPREEYLLVRAQSGLLKITPVFNDESANQEIYAEKADTSFNVTRAFQKAVDWVIKDGDTVLIKCADYAGNLFIELVEKSNSNPFDFSNQSRSP